MADDEFARRLDEWRRRQPDLPTRSEALRRIVWQRTSEDLGEPV